MYPFITLRGQHIEMTGLGFIIGIIVFYGISYYYARNRALKPLELLHALPTFMIITYFTGSYIGFILRIQHLIPYSMIELSQIIIPPNFGFNAAGLIIGFLISIFVFLYKLPKGVSKKRWIDCIALSFSGAMMIIGLFLTLGDHMIGLSTSSIIGIHALTPLSEMSKFNKVLPVGLFISFAGLLVYIISLTILRHQITQGRGMASFGIFFLLLAIILIFQNYSRHAVIRIASFHVDINQYILLSLSILSFIGYSYNYRKYSNFIYTKNKKPD